MRLGTPNQPVERMAAPALCLRFRALWFAATAHLLGSPTPPIVCARA